MDKAHVFVKIEEYKDIMDLVNLMREKIHHSKRLLDQIAQLKKQEDQELASWAKELEDIENRVATIDKTLLEPPL